MQTFAEAETLCLLSLETVKFLEDRNLELPDDIACRCRQCLRFGGTDAVKL